MSKFLDSLHRAAMQSIVQNFVSLVVHYINGAVPEKTDEQQNDSVDIRNSIDLKNINILSITQLKEQLKTENPTWSPQMLEAEASRIHYDLLLDYIRYSPLDVQNQLIVQYMPELIVYENSGIDVASDLKFIKNMQGSESNDAFIGDKIFELENLISSAIVQDEYRFSPDSLAHASGDPNDAQIEEGAYYDESSGLWLDTTGKLLLGQEEIAHAKRMSANTAKSDINPFFGVTQEELDKIEVDPSKLNVYEQYLLDRDINPKDVIIPMTSGGTGGGENRDNAVAYALSNAENKSHHSGYYYFSSETSGGSNCANFVSQSLYAGGKRMTEEWFWTARVSYTEPISIAGLFTIPSRGAVIASPAFLLSDDLYRHLIKPENSYGQSFISIRGDIFPEENYQNIVKAVRIGDVIAFNNINRPFDSDGYINHVGIVTQIKDGEIHFSAHSTTRNNVRLRDVLAEGFRGDIYFVHIKYEYFKGNSIRDSHFYTC